MEATDGHADLSREQTGELWLASGGSAAGQYHAKPLILI